MQLEGTPSDHLPGVLATGVSDIGYAFISLSAREPSARDAEYIEWHCLDHRPEQHRLPELRQSLRLVSTPACRAARLASEGLFDRVDHVMTYLFADESGIPGFFALGQALHQGGRMPLRLPSVGHVTGTFAGKLAADRAVAGADVIPWRPALGVYLLVEEGLSSPADLLDAPHVAGLWWYEGAVTPEPLVGDWRGRQITYCYLDGDPLAAAHGLRERIERRWASGAIRGLLAAPFFTVVPFEWERRLP
jgi:hypothetical protein